MWQLVILSVEYYENVSMVMYLQLNFDRTINHTMHLKNGIESFIITEMLHCI